jgi:hypothetical protein
LVENFTNAFSCDAYTVDVEYVSVDRERLEMKTKDDACDTSASWSATHGDIEEISIIFNIYIQSDGNVIMKAYGVNLVVTKRRYR